MAEAINIILWAALIQGFLLALIYMFSKKHRSLANFLLGMFLISLLLEALTTILPYDSFGNYELGYFSLPEVKIFIPLFFFHFVLEKLGSSYKFKRFLQINYGIGVIVCSLFLVNLALFFIKGTYITTEFKYATIDQFHLIQQIYAFVLSVIAVSVSFKEVINYQNLVKHEFSDMQMLKIKWLWQVIIMLIPATILWGLEIARILWVNDSQNDFVLSIWVFIAVFLYVFTFKAYQNPNLFEKLPKSVLKKQLHEDSTLDNNKCVPDQSNKIVSLMIEHKYFLDQNLTISDFAKNIDMSPRLISSCINKNLGLNFNEWVNGFRVDLALKIIKKDTNDSFSIEGIGNESGFKSRSAMYAAFQKKLGHSPGYFRKN